MAAVAKKKSKRNKPAPNPSAQVPTLCVDAGPKMNPSIDRAHLSDDSTVAPSDPAPSALFFSFFLSFFFVSFLFGTQSTLKATLSPKAANLPSVSRVVSSFFFVGRGGKSPSDQRGAPLAFNDWKTALNSRSVQTIIERASLFIKPSIPRCN